MPWQLNRMSRDTRRVIAILFIGLNASGFPFAAFGCLLAGVIVSATNLHHERTSEARSRVYSITGSRVTGTS